MNQSVFISYEDTKVLGLNPEFFVLWYSDVVKKYGKRLGEINLVICSDEYLLRLNNELLDHDYYTDIITEDFCFGDFIIGDLYISVDRVRENASVLGVTFEEEFQRVAVHGVLHLCGFKDKSKEDAEEMRGLENECLLNVPRETMML